MGRDLDGWVGEGAGKDDGRPLVQDGRGREGVRGRCKAGERRTSSEEK